MRIIKLDESSKKNILNDLLKRSPNNYDNFADSVNAILANVKENGDKALFQYISIRLILMLQTLKLLKKKLRKHTTDLKTLN